MSDSNSTKSTDDLTGFRIPSGHRPQIERYILQNLTSKWVWFLFLLTWLIIGTGSAFFWYKQHDISSQVKKDAHKIQDLTTAQLAFTEQKIKDQAHWQRQLMQQKDLIAKIESIIEADHQKIEDLSTQQTAAGQGFKNTALLNEIAFYIQLAQTRWSFDQNPKHVLPLIELALNATEPLTLPGYLSLKEALIADKLIIQSQPDTQIETQMLTLSALSKRISALQPPAVRHFNTINHVNAQTETTAKNNEVVSEDAQMPFWKRWFTQVSGFFNGHLYTLKSRTEDAAAPNLTPASAALIKQHLLLLLDQAQWALVKRDFKLYNQTLVQTRQVLQEYNASHQADIQAFIQTIRELESSAQTLGPALSVILTDSQKILRELSQIPQTLPQTPTLLAK
jgi:uncharacterized protein HemX